MSGGAEDASNQQTSESQSFSLRSIITATREFGDRTITLAKTHSPFAEDKLEAVDGAVSSVIHCGYQAIKRIAVNGHPAVIIGVTGVFAAVPSLPFGARATVRNAGLATLLATVMVYPDHLKRHFISTPKKE